MKVLSVLVLVSMLFAFNNNQYVLEKPKKKYTEAERILGEHLFNSVLLSKNKNISCESCHKTSHGFSSKVAFEKGTNGNVLKRRSPHLFNLTFGTSFFWDGRVNTLEEQFKVVLENPDEMDMNFDTLIVRLKNDKQSLKLFKQAYGDKKIAAKQITKAMVAFEKSLVTCNSSFDQFIKGDEDAITEEAKKGFEIFKNKGNCVACHKGANFTDNDFHNTGVITDDLGRQIIDKLGMSKEFQMRPYPFFSSYKAFKTPSLRNVDLHPPYFIDGSKKTLMDVVIFYNNGGENTDRTGVSADIKKLGLTNEEKQNLVAFLKSLTEL
jgi:cytochrome c peroxidase